MRRAIVVAVRRVLVVAVLLAAAGRLGAQQALVREHGGDPREPTGYLGITFTAPLERTVSASGIEVVHLGYPAIESVEPGSPAAAAGISAGDTIVAYDSVDVVNHEISLTRMLRPGRRVLVRLRRNGAVKEVAVTVAARPASFIESMGAPPSRVTITMPPMAGPMLMIPSDGGIIAAGAGLVRTNEDLRQALGVPRNSNGVLVIDVGEGTPAEASGLHAGDVVVQAGGDTVTGPEALARAVNRAAGRELPLRIVRARHLRTIVLRWK